MKTRTDCIHVPDNAGLREAIARTTHLGIGAHQDDLEIFAGNGILSCYDSKDLWFGGITVTNGSGSARTGRYKDFTNEEMMQVRFEEQNKAADIGKYAFQAQLGYTSSQVKDSAQALPLVEQLHEFLDIARPEVLYLHNPADKHDTHVAVLLRSLQAIRRMPVEERPRKVYGCEVWRDLDWLDDDKKVALPVDQHPDLAKALIEVFDSQVAGGKNYTAATLGRRHANATYFASHAVDAHKALTYAIDLTPVVMDDKVDLAEFTISMIEEFRQDVASRIGKLTH